MNHGSLPWSKNAPIHPHLPAAATDPNVVLITVQVDVSNPDAWVLPRQTVSYSNHSEDSDMVQHATLECTSVNVATSQRNPSLDIELGTILTETRPTSDVVMPSTTNDTDCHMDASQSSRSHVLAMLDTLEPLPLDNTIGTTPTAAATVPHFSIPPTTMTMDYSQHAQWVTHNPRSMLDAPVCEMTFPTGYWRADSETPAVNPNVDKRNECAVNDNDSTEAAAEALTGLHRPTMLKPLTAYNYFYRMERDNIVHGMQHAGDPIPPPDLDFSREKQHALLYQRWYIDPTKEKRTHRKVHGIIDFLTLSRVISYRWKSLPKAGRDFYQEVAKADLDQYEADLAHQRE